MAHVEEVGESTLDLKDGGMGTMGVEGNDGDGVGGLGEDLQEMLRKVLTMQGVWTVGEEVTGTEVVRTQDADVGEVRIFRQWLDLEGEGGCEGGVAILGVAEEKTVGLGGIGCKE